MLVLMASVNKGAYLQELADVNTYCAFLHF